MHLPRFVVWMALICLSFFSAAAVAQQNWKQTKNNYNSLAKTIWVQYNPGTLLEPEIPITATLLYKANQRIGLAADIGFFIASQNYSNDLKPYSGIRFKPEIKFYLEKRRDGPHGLYLSLQGMIKRTFQQKNEWQSQSDSSGQVIFSQEVNYKERKTVLGANLIFGGELMLDRNQRWMLDFYLGIGFRNKQFTAIGLPQGFTINYDSDPFARRVINLYLNGTYISLPLGIKVGYRLR